jgi:cytochrome c peroxidase
MKRNVVLAAYAAFVVLALSACGGGSETRYQTGESSVTREFNWNIPEHVPLPIVPSDNPVDEAMFQLGRHLFYDLRLSGNGSQSCGICRIIRALNWFHW